LEAQLEAGIRVLDIRCRHVNNKFAIHHGIEFQHMWFDQVLQTLVAFVRKNPSEFVLMRVKEEYTPSNNSRSFEATFEMYREKAAVQEYFWNPSEKNTLNPQVKDLRGKIVVLDNFSSTSTYGLNYGDPTIFEIQDDFRFFTNWDLYRKWTEVKTTLLKADESRSAKEDTIYVNYLSGSYGAFPYFVASGHIIPGTGASRLSTGFVDPISRKK
jgi:1-phosphatidylinositol phosphodiesterase